MEQKSYKKKTPSKLANFLTIIAALAILVVILYFFGAKEFPSSIEFK
jgi:hypothetical protein